MASMTAELATREGVQAVLLAGRAAYGHLAAELPVAIGQMPARLLPGSEAVQRALLLYTPLVGVERWSGDLDWIFCPKEQALTTRGTRLAVTVHDVLPFETEVPGMTPPRGLRSRMRWRLAMDRIVARVDLIATVSEYTKQRLLELFPRCREERVTVIGNGVGPGFYRTAQPGDAPVLQKYGVTPRRYVMVPGSFIERKGALVTLQAATELRRRGSDLAFIVVGQRHDPRLVARLEHPERATATIRLPGYIPDDDLAALLSNSLALMFPTRYEGCGIPALEAMAAGTPVVSSRAAAMPETVADAGILVAGPAEEYARAIMALAESDSLRERYIAAGRARAARFTWGHCVDRLLAGMRMTQPKEPVLV